MLRETGHEVKHTFRPLVEVLVDKYVCLPYEAETFSRSPPLSFPGSSPAAFCTMQPFYPAVGLPQPADATSQVRPEYVIPNHQIGTDTAPQLPALLQVKPQVTRASRACTGCRSKKTKCDEGQPCSVCEREGLECVFPIRPPTKYIK